MVAIMSQILNNNGVNPWGDGGCIPPCFDMGG